MFSVHATIQRIPLVAETSSKWKHSFFKCFILHWDKTTNTLSIFHSPHMVASFLDHRKENILRFSTRRFVWGALRKTLCEAAVPKAVFINAHFRWRCLRCEYAKKLSDDSDRMYTSKRNLPNRYNELRSKEFFEHREWSRKNSLRWKCKRKTPKPKQHTWNMNN